MAALPPPLVRFVELFNGRAYWESHEVLEAPWRSSGSRFYHGLILYASAFVHGNRGNAHGFDAQLRKAEDALRPVPARYLGVDVAAVLAHARGCLAATERARAGGWPTTLPVPHLSLESGLVRGDEVELRE